PSAGSSSGAGTSNLKPGNFKPATAFDNVVAMTVDDVDNEEQFDIVILDTRGALRRIWRDGEGGWREVELAQMGAAPQGRGALGTDDFDKNGSLDLLATGPRVSYLWLSDGRGGYLPPR